MSMMVKDELEQLVQTIIHSSGQIISDLKEGKAEGRLGLRRSARLPALAALYQELNTPVLLVVDRADRAVMLLEELGLWLPQAPRLLFPEPTPLFYENASWGDSIRRERLAALTMLASYHIPGAPRPNLPPVIIAPARALMTRSIPRREYLKAARMLKTDQIIQLEELARLCVTLGYEPSTMVIAPGQFARRGGILDIWPSAERQPFRLEFFGDRIDTMRPFDPATQRTIKPENGFETRRILITPAREYLLTDNQTTQPASERLSEFDIPLLHQTPASLVEYLPPQALVLIDDQQALEDAITEAEEQAVTTRQDYIQDGTLSPDYPVPYLTLVELNDTLAAYHTLELGPSSGAEDELAASTDGKSLAERFQAGPRFTGRLKAFIDYLLERHQQGEQLVIVSRQHARLQELWTEQRQTKSENQPVFLEGSLSEGWSFLPDNARWLHLLTDGEIFGWRRPESRRRVRQYAEPPEAGYSDLLVGDYVVHIDHGIGRFLGLVHRTVDGAEREYLGVEYADEAHLFVPVHQSDRLTRYVGPDNRAPTLSRLGSNEWRSVKTNAKEAVVEVAEDLLELYARRAIIQGFVYEKDTVWQQELEGSFPYFETDDQKRVIKEVKADMEAQRPMDRLICGDVGYGKTEVALRAAFKAVMAGKQVAILVPTTVLAQQHFHTFSQRLAAFPVVVEMLSRFRTPQQQTQIVRALSNGKIDIVIGTHRLLSGDVQFKDLGLLIIDEEQRFGVTHKEKLKKMRTEVDVLTLTATPIPRTLYMALSGARDISTINTPPEERLPIVTHVGPYSPKLVKQAILRELERGGQVFFVHNRVQTIKAILAHLSQLAPEARIAVAHGQMDEKDLAQRMEAFSQGEVDVLLSTSIIESGLDIPNANTLIVDRADTFGLAQLYQLRGRVGRGAQRAYAYFFRHNRRAPTFEGRQRLETIAENTQLGAGFSIAMRDLEIRGTGDILGTRQHGHIAAIGFYLYTSMLAAAVQRLRKEQGLKTTVLLTGYNMQLTPVTVELPIPTAIPPEYVPDKKTRLGLYRRMAGIRDLNELEALKEEFQDRFGALPDVVVNLFLQFKLKVMAERAGLSSITIENSQFALRYPESLIPEGLSALNTAVRVGKTALWIPFNGSNGQGIDSQMKLLLETLEQLQGVSAQRQPEPG